MTITKAEVELSREIVKIAKENIHITREFLLKDEILQLGANELEGLESDTNAIDKIAGEVVNREKIVLDIMEYINKIAKDEKEKDLLIDKSVKIIEDVIHNEMLNQALPLIMSLGKE